MLHEIIKFIGKAELDKYSQRIIWGVNTKGEFQQILNIDVRGWGAIKHLFKPLKNAEDFQDEMGQFICDAINEKIKREKG